MKSSLCGGLQVEIVGSLTLIRYAKLHSQAQFNLRLETIRLITVINLKIC